jgi:isopentenyl phosphate kinase
MAHNTSRGVDELIFVKLGGSLITDKSTPYTARRDVIARLCAEIRASRSKRSIRLLVGHGGGSFAHVSANHYQTNKGAVNENSWEGYVRVHEDAAKLNAIVCESFAQAGELVATVQPSSACVARSGRIEQAYTRPIELLLQAGLIPVVYGDVCLDEEHGMCVISTEEIFRCLAPVLRPRRIILVGKVDGVLDQNGNVIRAITRDNIAELSRFFLASDGIADVTGGMRHKVERSLEMGGRTQIINGLKPGLLERALLGDDTEGTVIEG